MALASWANIFIGDSAWENSFRHIFELQKQFTRRQPSPDVVRDLRGWEMDLDHALREMRDLRLMPRASHRSSR